MLNATEWDLQRVWKVIGDLQMRVARLDAVCGDVGCRALEKERGGEMPPRPTGWAIIRASFLTLEERGPYLDGFEVFCGERGFVPYEKGRPLADIGNMPSGYPTWFPFDDEDPAAVIRLLDLKGARVALLYRDTLEEVELR